MIKHKKTALCDRIALSADLHGKRSFIQKEFAISVFVQN